MSLSSNTQVNVSPILSEITQREYVEGKLPEEIKLQHTHFLNEIVRYCEAKDFHQALLQACGKTAAFTLLKEYGAEAVDLFWYKDQLAKQGCPFETINEHLNMIKFVYSIFTNAVIVESKLNPPKFVPDFKKSAEDKLKKAMNNLQELEVNANKIEAILHGFLLAKTTPSEVLGKALEDSSKAFKKVEDAKAMVSHARNIAEAEAKKAQPSTAESLAAQKRILEEDIQQKRKKLQEAEVENKQSQERANALLMREIKTMQEETSLHAALLTLETSNRTLKEAKDAIDEAEIKFGQITQDKYLVALQNVDADFYRIKDFIFEQGSEEKASSYFEVLIFACNKFAEANNDLNHKYINLNVSSYPQSLSGRFGKIFDSSLKQFKKRELVEKHIQMFLRLADTASWAFLKSLCEKALKTIKTNTSVLPTTPAAPLKTEQQLLDEAIARSLQESKLLPSSINNTPPVVSPAKENESKEVKSIVTVPTEIPAKKEIDNKDLAAALLATAEVIKKELDKSAATHVEEKQETKMALSSTVSFSSVASSSKIPATEVAAIEPELTDEDAELEKALKLSQQLANDTSSSHDDVAAKSAVDGPSNVVEKVNESKDVVIAAEVVSNTPVPTPTSSSFTMPKDEFSMFDPISTLSSPPVETGSSSFLEDIFGNIPTSDKKAETPVVPKAADATTMDTDTIKMFESFFAKSSTPTAKKEPLKIENKTEASEKMAAKWSMPLPPVDMFDFATEERRQMLMALEASKAQGSRFSESTSSPKVPEVTPAAVPAKKPQGWIRFVQRASDKMAANAALNAAVNVPPERESKDWRPTTIIPAKVSSLSQQASPASHQQAAAEKTEQEMFEQALKQSLATAAKNVAENKGEHSVGSSGTVGTPLVAPLKLKTEDELLEEELLASVIAQSLNFK